jgi:Ca-activated chloride channel family protein
MLLDWLKSLEFAWPYAFGLFILVPLMLFLYISSNNRKQASLNVSTAQSFAVVTWKNRMRHLPFVLRLLAVSAIIVALARPQKRNQEQHIEGEGIDIVLCMDVSGSMGSRDILPSRMEVAKEVAEEFVRDRPVDRIGLVIFSGESFTQCPITTDRNTLITQIRTLESRRYLADGTVIGEGLATAVDRLSKSTAKSKVIILLTDGKEDPPETRLIDPLTAIDIAKSRGVKVYTIGMSAAATIPDAPAITKGKKNPAIDFLDESLLQRIATETGGQYFRARDKAGLETIYRTIDQMEKTKVEVQNTVRFEERFLPFMLAALLFLFLEWVLRFTLLRKFP